MPLGRGRYLSPFSEASGKPRYSSPFSTAHAEADPELVQHRQFGGGVMSAENFMERQAARNLHYQGLVSSSIAGGYSEPLNVLAGSYVLPADTVSAMGNGNRNAGAFTLSKMFSSGPYGVPVMHGAGRPSMPNMMGLSTAARASAMHYARGGATGRVVRVKLQGGSYVVPPAVVRKIGGGNLERGLQELDAAVEEIRREVAAEQRKLPA